jgi:hypothetical protein
MKGRKGKEESRATELCQRLIVWQQTAESMRPSLRALARGLRTSHSLLQHYRSKLAKWQAEENWRRAREIRTRAELERRSMTPWEDQQYRVLDRRAVCLFIEGSFEDSVKCYAQEIEPSTTARYRRQDTKSSYERSPQCEEDRRPSGPHNGRKQSSGSISRLKDRTPSASAQERHLS